MRIVDALVMAVAFVVVLVLLFGEMTLPLRAYMALLESNRELLAALKGMVALYTNGTPYDANTTLAHARAAIRNAEQRS